MSINCLLVKIPLYSWHKDSNSSDKLRPCSKMVVQFLRMTLLTFLCDYDVTHIESFKCLPVVQIYSKSGWIRPNYVMQSSKMNKYCPSSFLLAFFYFWSSIILLTTVRANPMSVIKLLSVTNSDFSLRLSTKTVIVESNCWVGLIT